MKKIAFSILFLTFLLLCNVQDSEAHVLKTDGTIGAVLHIDPNDEPVAGLPSSFFLEFKDTDGKFSSQNCDCHATIYESGKLIYSQPIFQNSDEGGFSYTFPQKDVYIVTVNGKPKDGTGFTPFTLTYDIRVAKDGNVAKNSTSFASWLPTHMYALLFGGIILLSGGIFLVYKLKTKRNV